MLPLPPIDAHAHIKTGIEARELRALRAVIFAMTREPSEWAPATQRSDRACIWGLGCHPGVVGATEHFDAERLRSLLSHSPLIGEVGLDARSKVPKDVQLKVFRSVLEVASDLSRLVSIHSVGMPGPVLQELRTRPIAGAVLHWWRGSPSQTEEAVGLGCYFSLNGAEARNPKVIDLVPPERVLTETDYPHTKKQDKAADVPGAVSTIEKALAQTWSIDAEAVRRRIWLNLADLCDRTGTASLMPRPVQATLLTLPTGSS